jgi:hypothetical protein
MTLIQGTKIFYTGLLPTSHLFRGEFIIQGYKSLTDCHQKSSIVTSNACKQIPQPFEIQFCVLGALQR